MMFRELIKQKGLTQQTLADQSKVSLPTIKRALDGKNINNTSIERLAKSLDLSFDEFRTILGIPLNYIEALVHEQLEKLYKSGLSFSRLKAKPNEAIYSGIQESLGGAGKVAYFVKEFERLVLQAKNKDQFVMLENLVLYCSAFMVDSQTEINIETCQKIALRGEGGAWELRIYINSKLKELEGVKFETYISKETGGTGLSDTEGAIQVGDYTNGADDMEVFRELADSLGAKERLTTDKCPAQVREKNTTDRQQFKKYCQQLNERIGIRRDNYNNMFTFSPVPITSGLVQLFNEYLPELRVMTLQIDDGTPFLIPAKIKIQTLLIECLDMVKKHQGDLAGENMTKAEETKMSIAVFNGPVENAIVGDQNQIEINTKIKDLIPILKDLREALAINLTDDAEEIITLNEAIKQGSEKPASSLKVIENALETVNKGINQGTKVSKLYDKAKMFLSAVWALL